MSASSSDDRRIPPACSDAYASSSNSRCCGSIALDSAGEMLKKPFANRSACSIKPPCPAHDRCTLLRLPTSKASSSVQRADGTTPTASPDASSILDMDSLVSQLAGHRPTAETSDGGAPGLPSTARGADGAEVSAAPRSRSAIVLAMARAVG